MVHRLKYSIGLNLAPYSLPTSTLNGYWQQVQISTNIPINKVSAVMDYLKISFFENRHAITT